MNNTTPESEPKIPDFGDIPPESPECDDIDTVRHNAQGLALCPDFPLDWDSPCEFHGFSKHTSRRQYVVTLSVLKVQTQLGFYSTREQAARAYDAALWMLRPFAPYKARPNFPDDFGDITEHQVAAICPLAIAAHHRLTLKARSKGLSVEVLEAQRVCRGLVELDATSQYQRLMKHSGAGSFYCFSHLRKLINNEARLSKLPQIQREKLEAIEALKVASAALEKLSASLRANQDYYEKLVKDGIQS